MWYQISRELASKDIAVEDTIGIDLGITKSVCNSESRTFARLDEGADHNHTALLEAHQRGLKRLGGEFEQAE
ncbi:MAG: hypothetical protein J07HQW1_03372 [Haloquadratum walsbyi J07HQW1]|uniref:Uncharacterized protein n=1 Tax=Haloquadratum walsbyi J07HQW1 TaxID=1238424 RepID=U1PM56_9EURY|nr:MAG: hypothetical protein J07HQW1_03372 [Haloquadratum walsbyi J07HQW1]